MGRRGMHILRGQTSVAKTPHGLSAAQRSSGTGCSYAEVGRCKHHGSMMGSEALMQVGRVSLLLCDWVIHCALHKSCCMLLIVLHELVLQGRRLRVAAKTACMHLRIQHRHIDSKHNLPLCSAQGCSVLCLASTGARGVEQSRHVKGS